MKAIVAAAISTEQQVQVMIGNVSDWSMAMGGPVTRNETPEQARLRRQREAEAEFGLDPDVVNGRDRKDH